MLTFNPHERFSVEECLEHPYFEGIHCPEEEPVCDSAFDWSWDTFELKKETLQAKIYDEAVAFARR